MNDHCLIIIFAKAPLPGRVKTRLAPALGFEGAARLAVRMLEHTVDSALRATLGPVELCCAPDTHHVQFQRAGTAHGLHLAEQGDGDLGERMARAIERSLERFARVLLIGTDAPGLDAAVLQAAARALREHDAVFAPAADGGYVLVGLSRSAPQLFAGVEWSTPQVMQQTRERVAALGLSACELPTLHDVDEPADLLHVPPEWLA